MALASVQASATTYLFFDSGSYTINPLVDFVPGSNPGPRTNFWYIPGTGSATGMAAPNFAGAGFPECTQDFQTGRHSDTGINMAFCDGHVKYLKTQVVMAEGRKIRANQPSAWDPANPD